MATLPKALSYVKEIGRDVKENEEQWSYFTDSWTAYLTQRGILHGNSDPVFPGDYSIKERDAFYKSLSYRKGWAGASGHDAPMIAYDALLGAGASWEELCSRAMFHGGDSDSTGVIAGAWWGVLYGMDGVPVKNYEKLEYKERVKKVADDLFSKAKKLSWTNQGSLRAEVFKNHKLICKFFCLRDHLQQVERVVFDDHHIQDI